MADTASASPPDSRAQPAPGGAPTAPPGPRRRWRRRLLVLAVLAGLLVVCHAPLLRLLAAGLVVDDPPEPTEAVVLFASAGPFTPMPLDQAAALYRDGQARQVLVIDNRTPRVVRQQIVPPADALVRRELAARGVPAGAVATLPVTTHAPWDWARRLGDWLRDHPAARATVLCEELRTRGAARAARQVLGPDDGARLRWRAVRDRRMDAATWWHTRQGILTVAGAYIRLGVTCLRGEDPVPPRWDPDQYEQALRARAGR